jgi:hypothetical protein
MTKLESFETQNLILKIKDLTEMYPSDPFTTDRFNRIKFDLSKKIP